MLKVRVMHSAVRYYINKSGRWQPEKGVPVNQEDLAGTNIAFSLIALRGLKKLGVTVDPQQTEAYLHLWKVIGFYMGIVPELLTDDARKAHAFDKAIATRHHRPSAEGRALTHALLNNMNESLPYQAPEGFQEAVMHYFLGTELAKLLGIAPPKGTLKQLVTVLPLLRKAGMRSPAEQPAQVALQKKLLAEAELKL